MMGFGAIGPMPWLLGAIAMIIIWGGLWWGLSALVFHWPARDRSTPDRSHQHALRPVGPGWQIESFERWNGSLNLSSHHADFAQLSEQVHAESPGVVVNFNHFRKVGSAILMKDVKVSLVHHRERQFDHLTFGDRRHFQFTQTATNTKYRRSPNLQMDV